MTGEPVAGPPASGWVEPVPLAEIQGSSVQGSSVQGSPVPPSSVRPSSVPPSPTAPSSPSPAAPPPGVLSPDEPASGLPASGVPSPDAPSPGAPSGLLASPQLSAPPQARNRTPLPLFGARWPGPLAPPTRSVLAAVAAAGLVTATAVPAGRPGLGFLIVALTVVAAVLMAGRRPVAAAPADGGGARRPRLSPAVVWAATAVVLAAVGTVRAAEWLAALCLLAAAVSAALAVADRSFRGVTAGLLGVAAAMLRSVPWLGRRHHGGHGSHVRTVVAALVGVAVVAVAGSLLASADPAFAQVVDVVLPTLDAESTSRWIALFAFGAVAVSGACFLLLAPPEPVARRPRGTRLRCLDWALPTGLLVALFAVFVAVQFVVLFGGDSYVRSTTGLTYAEYARGGFWQLLAVTVLALGVLVLGSRWAPVSTLVEQAWKRGLLGMLAGLTLVIVTSAIHRMWLYQEAYGFTVLRLLVLTVELWLGAGFLIAQAAVLRLRPLELARPMVAAGVVALLGLAVLDPERFIAQHNVARLAETGEIDTHYLGTLSADAVPALLALPEPQRTCTLSAIAESLAEPDDWRSRNLSREDARAALALLPLTPLARPDGRCGWDAGSGRGSGT